MGQHDTQEDALMLHGSSGACGSLFVGRFDASRGLIRAREPWAAAPLRRSHNG